MPYFIYTHFVSSITEMFLHIIARIEESIGLRETRLHDLRHTYAMMSLQNGDAMKTVQHNIGHATEALTLDVYGHASKRTQKDSADRMQSYIDDLKVAE